MRPLKPPVDVTVVILTFNEESNLPLALDSVRGWARRVFVVDSYSTDKTVDMALARAEDGVRVVQHAFVDYSAQWNWALTHLPIESPWTMKLDADERLTSAFKRELEEILRTTATPPEGFSFRRRFFFMGAPLLRGGASSTYVLHLWRTGQARFEERPVNEHVILSGPSRKMRSFVDHVSESSLADWIDKHNRYSSLEAQSGIRGDLTGEVAPRFLGSSTERRMWLKRWHSRLPARHLLFFLYQYFFRLGFLDGRRGFRYAFLRAAFFYWIDLKIEESRVTGKAPEVIWPRRGEAHPVVATTELQSRVDRGA